MKKMILCGVVFWLALTVCGCKDVENIDIEETSASTETTETTAPVTEITEELSTTTAIAAEKASPPKLTEFTKDLRTLIWGSEGWNLFVSQSGDYVFANGGRYVIRYSVKENKVDKIIDYANEYPWNNGNLYISNDDGYAVLLNNVLTENGGFITANTSLIDFENDTVTVLAENTSLEDFTPEILPEDLREKFDFSLKTDWENMYFADPYQKLKYKIERGSDDESDYAVFYAIDDAGNKKELKALRGDAYGMCAIAVSPEKIVHFAATDSWVNLWTYKFVLIGVDGNKVLQECPAIMDDEVRKALNDDFNYWAENVDKNDGMLYDSTKKEFYELEAAE